MKATNKPIGNCPMGPQEYKEGTLAYALGNVIKGESLPIQLGAIPAKTEITEDHLLRLAFEWSYYFPRIEPSPIKSKLADAYHDWLVESTKPYMADLRDDPVDYKGNLRQGSC